MMVSPCRAISPRLITANRFSRYAHGETALTHVDCYRACIARRHSCGIKVIMSSKMKVAQISKPGGDFELVERDIPEPGTGQESARERSKRAAFATATHWSRRVSGPACNILACRGTKLRDTLMPLAAVSRIGKKGSASGSAGTAGMILSVNNAAAAILRCAAIVKSPVSTLMAVMPNT